MYSNKLYTPLRYPGGKGRFAPFIARLMELNGCASGHYMEPYAGGAAVALELLFHGYASAIHINDADPALYAFWLSVTSDPEGMLRLIHDTPVTMDEWLKWRNILFAETTTSLLEKGFATLFLNRTNRSGILKAGVIGGKSQSGDYRIDARFKKDVLAARVIKIAEHANRINVYNKDALDLLCQAASIIPSDSLIYLDPPYYIKGKGLYRNFYTHEDHQAIASHLQTDGFDRKWVVSYDAVDQIKEMYASSKSRKYGLYYTAQRRYDGNEIMFFSQGLKVPRSLPDLKSA